MERKTRSGKIVAPQPAPPAGKKKGRKKKSEIAEMPAEVLAPVTVTRRSTRGRNPDQSLSESSFQADDSNASSFTTDVSTIADSSIVSVAMDFEQIIENVSIPLTIKTEEVVEVPEEEHELKVEPVSIDDEQPEQVIEPEVSDELCNLEQKMSDVILIEKRDEVDVPIEKISNDDTSEDVEMQPEPVQIIKQEQEKLIEDVVIVESPTIKEEIVEPIVEPLKDDPIDFMENEDDSKFVRRSRRLQVNYTVETIQFKAEEPAKDFPLPVEAPSESFVDPTPETMLKDDIKTDSPVTEPEMVPDPHATKLKPTLPVQLKVEHTDERLKRYETIRDNIYSKKSDKKVCKVNKTMKCDCTITEEEVKNGEIGCQYNCINRLLYIECGVKCRCGEYCDNQQFQRYNYASCSVFDTQIKGFGIRADQDIPNETFIIEYVGEVLDNKQFEKRAKKYSENKNVHYYFMALKSNAIIDATKKGNISRFINHSCDPNAETQKWTVNGELRVGFFSRKDIKAGEEITFDYQYQRYGKEAQKCFCEAEKCRGWIGENPLDDEDEEELSKSPEIDDAKAKKTKARKGRKPKASLPEQELKDDEESEDDGSIVSDTVLPSKRREVTRKLATKLKRKGFEDLEIEGEINDLTQSGLKNRDHTIRLSRLVVRAKTVDARSRILKILINAELPCRRLFLDYNGLRLLHNWMMDINVQSWKASIPDIELCIEMMNALDLLPITNKTVLRISKVLDRVEKWKHLDLEKNKLAKEKKLKEEKKQMTKEEKKQAKAEKKKNKTGDKMEVSEEEPKPQNEAEPSNEAINTSQADEELDALLEIKAQLKKVAEELLEKWEGLQEDFKIPKKQKQEIMIEHEREADNDDWDDELPKGDVLSQDRYKNRFGDEPTQNRPYAPYRKQHEPHVVNKLQHRQAFEMRIAQENTEKKMMLLHENNCAIFGLNPTTTSPLDVPVRVNRVTGEYNTIDGRIAPPPPNHYQFKYEPLTLSTNPDDYFLPKIDLPEHWRFALDEYGRIYYYHEKIRQPQWDAPIKILPLKVNTESEVDSPDSDESTTETEDSEEEELRELLEMLKRKKNLPPATQQSTAVNPLILQSGDADDDELEKKIMSNMMKNPLDQPVKLTQTPQKRLKKKKRRGLTSMQFIRPRTDADKLYGRLESKRYKEVKEKLRQKKRRILKGEAGPDDGSSEDDDDIVLNDSIESRRFVDEIDILEKTELDGVRKKKEVEKKTKKPKPVVLDQADLRRQFRDEMIKEIAKFLQPYREESCEKGRITNDVDFHSLVSKLTYSVFMKESRHCQTANSVLKATDSVKGKSKEYIKKYMGKFDGSYQRKEDEQDYASILNKL